MELQELIQKYLAAAGVFGKSIALSELGLSKEEIEEVFSSFDEDYNISRYFHFACAAGANYQINGFAQTHVAIDPGIESAM